MKQYMDLLTRIVKQGDSKRPDRTGVGCTSIFGHQMRFNLKDGFPLLETKRTFWKGVVCELFWMLSGSTNTNDLPKELQHWWMPWANEDGSLGETYGKQFRNFFGMDQLESVHKSLKENPFSRRHLISLWNPAEVDKMNLPPCHGNMIQFFVSTQGELSCQMYQRSADVFIGIPVNIAFYALLTELLAHDLGYTAGEFVHTIGDAHLYDNHQEAYLKLCEQHSQWVRNRWSKKILTNPKIRVEIPQGRLLSFVENLRMRNISYQSILEKITLRDYNPLPPIKVEIAV